MARYDELDRVGVYLCKMSSFIAIRRRRRSFGKTKLALPISVLDRCESPRVCAKRESWLSKAKARGEIRCGMKESMMFRSCEFVEC